MEVQGWIDLGGHVILPMIAKLISQHLPQDMENETVRWLVDKVEIYILPLLAGLGLAARHLEARNTREQLSGTR